MPKDQQSTPQPTPTDGDGSSSPPALEQERQGLAVFIAGNVAMELMARLPELAAHQEAVHTAHMRLYQRSLHGLDAMDALTALEDAHTRLLGALGREVAKATAAAFISSVDEAQLAKDAAQDWVE